MPAKGPSPFDQMPPITIAQDGVKKLLLNLKTKKATGPDGLSAQFLKSCANEITPILSLIFQASLKQGITPNAWKEAFVSPIFKKGDRSLASNSRPVSLTSICCKCLEHILFSQIMHHLDSNEILTPFQHGFRKSRSCETQLIVTVQDLANGLNKKSQIDAILLDFSKAFDKVPHQRLLHKLNYYGINGLALAWIGDFLSGRTQQVVLDGEKSSISKVVSGVPQGTVLGPLLFLLFINDLPGKVSSTARLFADDSLVYREISNLDDSVELQRDLDKLQAWESDWQMSFHPEKCQLLRVTNKRKHVVNASYNIHDHPLESVKDAKYLGVHISSNLSWNTHIDRVTKKANSTLGFLRRNISSCPSSVKKAAYTTFVRPSLEYGCHVWSPHTTSNIKQVEAVQRRAARFITGDRERYSSPTTMLQQLGIPTLAERRDAARLVMTYKIVNGLVAISPDSLPAISASAAAAQPYLAPSSHSPDQFFVPSSSINAHLHSFFPASIRLWNGTPLSTRQSASVDLFRSCLTRSQ